MDLGSLALVAVGALLGAGAAFLGQQYLNDRQRKQDNIAAARAVYYEAVSNADALNVRYEGTGKGRPLSETTFRAHLPKLAEVLSRQDVEKVVAPYLLIPDMERGVQALEDAGAADALSGEERDTWQDWRTDWEVAYRTLRATGWPGE